MKYATLAVKFLLLAYLGYLLYFMVGTDGPAAPGYHPPFVLWILDTINLFIHEGGHFFTRPFGIWVYVFGGSLVQCLLPLLLLILTARQTPHYVMYPAFWFGENLVNVSYYIKDAPDRKLKLIAKGVIHDWNWLLSGNLEMAEGLAMTVFTVGAIACAGAMMAGVWYSVQSFKETN
jgi:hypothetical protein